eukprot:6316729-Prymnesium_polylepis.2
MLRRHQGHVLWLNAQARAIIAENSPTASVLDVRVHHRQGAVQACAGGQTCQAHARADGRHSQKARGRGSAIVGPHFVARRPCSTGRGRVQVYHGRGGMPDLGYWCTSPRNASSKWRFFAAQNSDNNRIKKRDRNDLRLGRAR